jgi:AcrR family transcriptional regulator
MNEAANADDSDAEIRMLAGDSSFDDLRPPRLSGDMPAQKRTKAEDRQVTRTVSAQVQSERLVTDRRERIIRAAIAVFHRRGFHVATTADIAREAGLTQSNLYNYVKSKQDVLFLVCEHLVGLYESVLDDAIVHHKRPYDRIVEGVRSIVRVMSTYRDEVQLLYNETHSLDKADRVVIMASISRFIGRFQQLLDEYEVAHGSTKIGDKRVAANFLSFLPAMVSLRSWDLSLHKCENVEESILQFILNGLGIKGPVRRKKAEAEA